MAISAMTYSNSFNHPPFGSPAQLDLAARYSPKRSQNMPLGANSSQAGSENILFTPIGTPHHGQAYEPYRLSILAVRLPNLDNWHDH